MSARIAPDGEHRDSQVVVDGRSLQLAEIEAVARRHIPASLANAAIPGIARGRDTVLRIVESELPAYGVNTGFGSLSNRTIPRPDVEQLQRNLLHSHASGAGEPLPDDVVRAAMLLRANSLAIGLSGVRPELIQVLLDMLNAGIHPLIPSQGSLGASGDLAPLAHMALAAIGEGRVQANGQVMPTSEALATAGITPIKLGPKEALALINGTPIIAAIASLALIDAKRLVELSTGIAGLSMYAIGARRDALDDRLHEARPHAAQIAVASRLRELVGELASGARVSTRIQDPYSIRCIPQVYGAVLDSLQPLGSSLAVEFNSATDNPLIFSDPDQSISGGNFHGHPLALPIEYAKIGIASLGTMIERRVNVLVDGGEYGLPAFLVSEPGINSGFMIAHYLTAGLVAENRVLAHPSAVDSVPTSANIEDYNSMGATAARHFAAVVDNVVKIVAVEGLCAAQACDLRGNIPGGELGKLYRRIREFVPLLERDDRIMADDIETIRQAIQDGELNFRSSEGNAI